MVGRSLKLGIPHYRFFHGHGATHKNDVVLVPCNDDYGGLMQKDKLGCTMGTGVRAMTMYTDVTMTLIVALSVF